ncbi:hypothetical protein B0H17DRAFT_714865 [Mycena rosella]|uniref:Uncharacterized protein n=1 Tax=Mycena rosella TaxID=1033263 RepID=A0AAD7GFL7_MYCRO|nr:hypothetical protein B0H17DRAFT_714865 [Mycena rosella]
MRRAKFAHSPSSNPDPRLLTTTLLHCLTHPLPHSRISPHSHVHPQPTSRSACSPASPSPSSPSSCSRLLPRPRLKKSCSLLLRRRPTWGALTRYVVFSFSFGLPCILLSRSCFGILCNSDIGFCRSHCFSLSFPPSFPSHSCTDPVSTAQGQLERSIWARPVVVSLRRGARGGRRRRVTLGRSACQNRPASSEEFGPRVIGIIECL